MGSAEASLDRSCGVIVGRDALAEAILRLERENALALPWLERDACAALVETTHSLPFRKARPVVGEGERVVYQDFDICMPVPVEHPLHHLRQASERALQAALAVLGHAALPETLWLNDLVVQHYPPGSQGITPHRDHVRYVGLVAIVLLAGDGAFSVCEDRSGAGERLVEAQPGALILMRAPGLFGRRDRPFHQLKSVTRERITVGLRHDSTKPPGEG